MGVEDDYLIGYDDEGNEVRHEVAKLALGDPLDVSTLDHKERVYITSVSEDDNYMEIAEIVKKRAECRRLQVGAVVVYEDEIVGTGFNKGPEVYSCLAGECPRGLFSHSEVPAGGNYDTGPARCIAVHAEAAAIISAGKTYCHDATLYVTENPCPCCTKLIRFAGISRLVTPIYQGPVL